MSKSIDNNRMYHKYYY